MPNLAMTLPATIAKLPIPPSLRGDAFQEYQLIGFGVGAFPPAMVAYEDLQVRYNNSSEVVRAALRILDAEEKSVAAGSFPPGSLRHLYTKTQNRAERRTAKASTLKVEAE